MAISANLRKLLLRGAVALLGGLLLAGTVPALSHESDGRVPMPNMSDRKGDKCIRDEAYMRRHHMDMLKHKRDLTMRQGIRTKEDSLQNCIACHASQKNNSVVGSKENFCQSCHNYVGVKLDCFECHASKPKDTAYHPLITSQNPLAAKMRGELQGGTAQPTKAEGAK